MKLMCFILFFSLLSVANAWEIKEVIDSEGVETNVIKCNNGSVKAIYFEEGYYKITPRIYFNTLEEAATKVCKEQYLS